MKHAAFRPRAAADALPVTNCIRCVVEYRVVKAVTDDERWRDKYFDSLSSLENEQQRFRSMEAALKRLAGRLCTGALGQSPRLDEQVRKVQSAIRRDVTVEEIDQFTPALTDAIQALDQPSPDKKTAPVAVPVPVGTPPEPRDPIVGDERVRAVLATLLAELRRDPELANQAAALDMKLTAALTRDQLLEVLLALTEMVGRRIQRVESAKQEIEALLSQLVGRLDEIGRFVADHNQSQSEAHASSETLNLRLVGEMKAMTASVDSSGDLQQIRWQVRNRLESIDRYLQQFRQREDTRSSAMKARNEQMRTRIDELEAEAKRLHGQLKDEARLSTIDALTRIPNRLAYENHIEEELKRWQRFKQPTCLAVWDVDHFKRVNDGYGHRAGDRVLRAVAESLASQIRSTDFVARYGGEEFVMILPGTLIEDATQQIDAMRTAIAGIGFHFRGSPVTITISIGVTALRADDSAGAAFDRADKALYRAKENGRNRCVAVQASAQTM